MSEFVLTPVSTDPKTHQKLSEKLAPKVGTGLRLQLVGGIELSGVLEEVGVDYLSLLSPKHEEAHWVPFSAIVTLCPEG